MFTCIRLLRKLVMTQKWQPGSPHLILSSRRRTAVECTRNSILRFIFSLLILEHINKLLYSAVKFNSQESVCLPKCSVHRGLNLENSCETDYGFKDLIIPVGRPLKWILKHKTVVFNGHLNKPIKAKRHNRALNRKLLGGHRIFTGG